LELLGSQRRLFVRHMIVVIDGHCQTKPYAHLHVNGAFADGAPIGPLYIPASRVPLESVLWHLIAEWGVAPRIDAWQAILSESVDGFHARRRAR
jgi:hypothetical protein